MDSKKLKIGFNTFDNRVLNNALNFEGIIKNALRPF